jgi:hypothetical protein
MRKSRQQLKAPPQKWRKYELLEDFGLADTEYLRRTIHRFPREQRTTFLSQLREEVKTATADGKREGQHLFVMKFVPRKLAMLLPNIRVQNMADLHVVENALRDEPFGDYEEIWFCRTNVSVKSFSVAGRILVDSSAGVDAHIIEQVWRCSPRLIESLGLTFPYPFVRAARSGWGWPPRIDQIHIPPHTPESAAAIRAQFAVALRKLDSARERLEAFVEAVLAVGLDVCCLEYKIEGERLQIIDWDTTNDSLVLNKLLRHENT